MAPGGNDRKDMYIELVSHISCELHKQIVCGHKFTLIFPVHQGRCIYHLKSNGTSKIWPVNTLYRHTYKPAFCQGNVHSSLVHSPLNTQTLASGSIRYKESKSNHLKTCGHAHTKQQIRIILQFPKSVNIMLLHTLFPTVVHILIVYSIHQDTLYHIGCRLYKA